eukprot:2059338-Pyramimonas_sp.AAC.1
MAAPRAPPLARSAHLGTDRPEQCFSSQVWLSVSLVLSSIRLGCKTDSKRGRPTKAPKQPL